MLNVPKTWLKRWVTARVVPHQRKGNPAGKQQRGVWFTLQDIPEIGRRLPELMAGHSGGRDAGSSEGPTGPLAQPKSGGAGPESDGKPSTPSAPAEPPVVDIAAWAQLKAHRPRPRST
jgi:hypothetical protein